MVGGCSHGSGDHRGDVVLGCVLGAAFGSSGRQRPRWRGGIPRCRPLPLQTVQTVVLFNAVPHNVCFPFVIAGRLMQTC